MFRGVPECSGVLECPGVPGFSTCRFTGLFTISYPTIVESD